MSGANYEDVVKAGFIEASESHINQIHIRMLGCGGTGSKLMPELCQAIALFNENPMVNGYERQAHLRVCDPDIVEVGNLNRQHFIAADVGKNKAEVLANRYGHAYGIPVGYITTFIDTPEDVGTFLWPEPFLANQYNSVTILITAVDNHPTRRIVHQFLTDTVYSTNVYRWTRPIFWIDLANEETNGYVTIGYLERNGGPYNNPRLNRHTPIVTEVFPDILADKPDVVPSRIPCGAGGVQDLNVNAAAATHCMSVIRALLKQMSTVVRDRDNTYFNYSKLINYYQIEFGVKPPLVTVKYNVERHVNAIKPAREDRKLIGRSENADKKSPIPKVIPKVS